MEGFPSQCMAFGDVEVVVMGIAQDGGVPQAGCSCERCVAALNDPTKVLHPVSLAIRGLDGSIHLIEATRGLAHQLGIAATSIGMGDSLVPDSVSLTHAHLGHIDGIGQFGKEAMGGNEIPLFASSSVIRVLKESRLSDPFQTNAVHSGTPFSPTEGCGFELEFVRVPHRDEYSDTHAIRVIGPSNSLLFLPDHDDWEQTLGLVGEGSIREWLTSMGVGFAMIDGTFWSDDELGGRDMTQVPHPTISESLDLLGERKEGDPEIIFIHLNHTNPALDGDSSQADHLSSLGWSVGEQGSTILL
ncbi:MAG: MBL fold metallo-hydrolase [Candidatus Thalassarchaeaceae archaeon]|nr:MBL fold metallo-hydrolase [Candidatus Thalassarchaeaceae archaeon]